MSNGRRSEFGSFGWAPDQVPDPQDEATFARSRLDWSEPDRQPHAGLLVWHRRLIRLRRERPELADPRPERTDVTFDEEQRWLVVSRAGVQVVVNLGKQDHAFMGGRPVLLAGSADAVRVEHDRLVVPPDAVAIVELRG